MNTKNMPDGINEKGELFEYSLTDKIRNTVTDNYNPCSSRGRIFGTVRFLHSKPEMLLRNHIISISTGLSLWYMSGLRTNWTLPATMLGGAILGSLATTLYDQYHG